MIKPLMYRENTILQIAVLATVSRGVLCPADGAVGGGESRLDSPPPPLQTLHLTLRGALAAAVDNNPDVLLYRERIEAARGQVQTQLGTMLPNLSSSVRQSRQTVFRGTFMRSASKELKLARERYTVITASSHFELTNGLTAAARARENLVDALFQLNAAPVNLARATGNLNTLQ